MLPGVTYPGGKNGAGVYQTIINLMPPHRVYIEPFLGGGAVMRLKRPAELNIGVDLDPQALKWRCHQVYLASRIRWPLMRSVGAGFAVSIRRSSAESADGGHRFKFIHADVFA